jgi:hypothetical protein
LEIPELLGLALGDTEFASTAAAWDALPERTRRHLDGRRAVFDFARRKRAVPPTQAEIDRYPPVTHPIVRTHPVTGRKCLYVMRDDCTGIEGWEAETLIAALADHIVKPALVSRAAAVVLPALSGRCRRITPEPGRYRNVNDHPPPTVGRRHSRSLTRRKSRLRVELPATIAESDYIVREFSLFPSRFA